MAEYSIWTNDDGGFCEGPWSIKANAEAALAELLASDLDALPEDYQVMEICPDHQDQPKDGCEECDSEDAEDA